MITGVGTGLLNVPSLLWAQIQVVITCAMLNIDICLREEHTSIFLCSSVLFVLMNFHCEPDSKVSHHPMQMAESNKTPADIGHYCNKTISHSHNFDFNN